MKNFELGFNEYQKPFLIDNPRIHFSFSYSKNLVLIGVSQTTIGIDVEYVDEKMEITEIAPTIMHPDELDHFHSLSGSIPLQRQFFFRLFSLKESIIKAFGTGLYFPVKELNVLDNRIFTFRGTSFECKPLSMEITQEYCFAICNSTKQMG
jgi:4'-phosphopantetheinyl transferase